MYKVLAALVLMFIFSSCTLHRTTLSNPPKSPNVSCYTNFEFTKLSGDKENFSTKDEDYPKVQTVVARGSYILVMINLSKTSEKSFMATEMYKEKFCVENK